MRCLVRSLFAINPVSLTLGAILLVVTLFLSGIPILELIELKTYDLRFLSRGQLQPSPAVVMAVIDEKSLNTEGRWPWPRSKLAALVDLLSHDGASVIGLDIAFPEPDENSQLALLNQVAQQVDALAIQHPALTDFLNDRKKHADNDLTLAQAIKNSSATVVLGYFFHMSEADLNYRLEQHDIDRQLQRINSSKYPFITYSRQPRAIAPFFRAYAPESNLEMLTEAAASAGYFSLKNDQDGILRWMPLMLQGGEDLFPPLAVSTVWHYLGRPPLTVQVGHYGVEGVQMGNRFIPTDENGLLLINYLGPQKTFLHFSISDILSGKLAKGTFTDKIVLVGTTATGIYDLRSTPFSTVYPGAEVHATVIDNILTQNFLTKPTWMRIYDLLAVITLGALLGFTLPRMGALPGLLLVLGLCIGYIGMARWLFVNFRVWLNMVYPLLVLATNYTMLTVYHYVTEERERKKIQGAFEHYVSPEVIDEIMQHPEKLNLGGERRVLTVLFSDVQNFTAISESMDSAKLVALLNEYLTAMTTIVLKYRGTLDKYIGDAIMAFYGAPVAREDHAFMACYTAIGMLEELKKLREIWSVRKLPQINMRIGMHTGEVTVGNMGSAKRFDYTVMGDTVNLASRLEGLNKAYGTAILISEDTACLIEKCFLLREIDIVQVVGRKRPVRIYELLAATGTSLPKEQEKAYSAYATGLEAYRQQSWDNALELFKHSLALWPKDSPSRIMLERCQIYQQTPPPEEWDGVFEHTHK
jgi:adenylate cyclase